MKIRKLVKYSILTVGLVAIASYLFKNESDSSSFDSFERPAVLFTNFHPQSSGGHLTYLKGVIESDLASKYRFGLAVPEGSDVYRREYELPVEKFVCDFPGNLKEIPQIIMAIKRFRAICKEFNPQIVHTNGGHDNTIVGWGTLFMKNKPKIVRTFHAVKRVGKDPYHHLLYNKMVDQNIFVSKEAYWDYNVARGGLKIDQVSFISNGVDLERFRPRERNLELLNSLSIAEGTFIFGSNAGLGGYKRVDVMLQAAARLRDQYDFKVLVLGSQHKGELYTKQAEALGLENHFKYVGYHSDTRDYCSLFDVGFLLSDSVETVSFASREMASMGIPLLSSSYGGLKENVEDYYNGVLVQPGNVDAVVEAMQFFMEMPKAQLQAYREHAREKALRDFGAQQQLKSLDEVYQNVIH